MTGKIRDLESQLAAKPATTAPPAATEVKTAAATPPADKPKAEKFETYELYLEALNDWQFDQREARKAAAEAQKSNEASAATQRTKWLASVEEAKDRHDDWKEVFDRAGNVPLTAAMQQTVFEMDRGPDVLYFLATHPEEAQRIAKFAPFVQARELGRIEDKLDPLDDDEEEPEPTKKPATVSRAPKPAKTIVGNTASEAGKEPDPKDFAKWSKWKDRQEARDAA